MLGGIYDLLGPVIAFLSAPDPGAVGVKKICDESYRPLLQVFEEYPNSRATINFNSVLTEMLMDCGHGDVIEGIRRLAENGQLEFTGTGKYHPILPLILTSVWR